MILLIKKEVYSMKTNKLLKIIGIFATAFVVSSCSNYSSDDIKKHRAKTQQKIDSYQEIAKPNPKPVVQQEVEIFDKKVSATFFNEPLNVVLPAIVAEVKYASGIEKTTPVSLEANGLNVATSLHKILKPIGLSYIRTTGGILVIKQKRITFKAFNQPLDIVLNAMLGDISYMVRDGAELSLKNQVSVEFNDLPIEMALDRLLSQLDLHWRKESENYIIFRDKEQLFSIDFPLLQQQFSVNSSRKNTSDVQTDKENEGTIANASSRLISSGTSASLSNLTDTIEKFLTPDGKVIIHKEMGMVWVKDRASVVDRIGDFLARINTNLSKLVNISGVITEVELSEDAKTGIDWSAVSGDLTRLGATIGNAGGLAGANFTLGWNGDRGTTNQAYIDALKVYGDVNVISRPSLRVANNAIGSLIVGQNTSYVAEIEATASSSDTTRYASKLESLQTGLNFYVLPHIISSTEAILYISPELTSLQEMRLISSGDNAPEVEAPTISMRQTQTVVPIKNGESLVIGGLMAETDKAKYGKTAGVGSVPLFGRLFQTEDSSSGVSEFSLMVKVSW
jgi:type IVB pilus formation R64 PilN family outer membrane protein